MPNARAVLYASCLCLLLIQGHSQAAGFDNYVVGTKASLNGAPVVSFGNDSSAVFWNPAGMVFQETDDWNTNVYGYLSHLQFTYSATYEDGTNTHDETVKGLDAMAFIPGGFTTRNYEQWAIGYGFYIPYAGAGSSYTNFQKSGQDLEAFAGFPALTAAMAYRVNDKLSIGAGVSLYMGIFESTNGYVFKPDSSVPVIVPYKSEFSDYFAGYGGHLSFLYQATDAWSVGMTMRSEIPIEMDGDETINGTKSDSTLKFTLPMVFDLGVGFKPRERLKFNTYLSRRYYGDLKEFEFELAGKTPTLLRDAWTIGAGVEYELDNTWELSGGIKWIQGASEKTGISPVSNDIDYFVPGICLTFPLSESVKLETGYQLTYGPAEKVNNQTFEVVHHTLLFGVTF